MATIFTTSNRLADLTPFDPGIKNAWGTPNSENMVLVDQALDGLAVVSLAGQTTFTLSANSGSPDQARERMQSYTGALTGTCTVTVPNVQKWGYARNATTGGQNVILTTGGIGGTTLTLPADGFWYLYWTDGNGSVSGLRVGLSSLNVSPGGLTIGGASPVLNDNGTYSISITGHAASASSVPWSGVTGTGAATVQFDTLGVVHNLTVLGTTTTSGVSAFSSNGCFVTQPFIQSTPIAWTFPCSYSAGGAYVGTGFMTTSDARSKEGIEEITTEQAHDWIMRASPVTFRWKDGGRLSSGFIAQQEYLSGRGDALVPIPDERPEYAESDGVVAAGFRLTRDYNHDVAYLTKALQDVLRRLEALETCHSDR